MRSTLLLSLVLILTLTSSALADPDCRIGIYGDAEGSVRTAFAPDYFTPFEVYVVMWAEAPVSAVAFEVAFEGPEYLIINWAFGPSSDGIDIVSAGGHNVGLGECAIGFNQYPILVATITMMQTGFGLQKRGPIPYPAHVLPNPDSDPEYPLYSTCQGELRTCENIEIGWIYPVKVESTSWGEVKSLY